MKTKIKRWIGRKLIEWGNKLHEGDYYDFGSRIVAINSFGNNLFVGTEKALYCSKTGKKWKRVLENK